MKIMTHVDKVHSATTKINPLLSDFCYPDVLVAWQQSTPKSENSKWVNNSCKLNSQGYGKSKTAAWLFPAPWQTSFLFNGLKPSPGYRVNALKMKKKKRLKCVFHLGYTFYNLQWSRHPLQWTNHTSLNKNFTNFLRIITVTIILNHQVRTTELMEKPDSNRTKINYMGSNELLNMMIIFMTFCLTYYWLLIFVFQI